MSYLNAPVGYPIASKIEKTDIGGLKSFLINTTPDESMHELVRAASDEEVVKMLTDSGFTFDEQWYGSRELPTTNGAPASRLDDPAYRRSLGIVE